MSDSYTPKRRLSAAGSCPRLAWRGLAQLGVVLRFSLKSVGAETKKSLDNFAETLKKLLYALLLVTL